MRRLLTFLVTVVCLTPPVQADVLVLQDGNSLSGSMVRIREGTLVFRTNLSGQMMAPMDRVASLTTDRNFMITFKENATAYGRLSTQGEQTVLVPLGGGAPQPVALGAIQEAMAIPAAPAAPATAPGALSKPFAGTAEVGVGASSGGADGVQGRIRLEAGGKGDVLDWGAGLFAAGGEDAAGDRVTAGALVQDAGEASWQPYLMAGINRDTGNQLDWRGNLSLGLYHAFFPDATDVLNAYFGLDLAREQWAADAVAAESGAGADTGLNLHLGLRYYKAITKCLALAQTMDLYPGLSDSADFRALSETSLMMPLGARLRLRLDFSVGYESSPGAVSADHWSTSVGAGVGVNF